jgi:hypothetical protein
MLLSGADLLLLSLSVRRGLIAIDRVSVSTFVNKGQHAQAKVNAIYLLFSNFLMISILLGMNSNIRFISSKGELRFL